MKFDHFVPCLNPQGDFTLDRLQPFVWQTVIDALTWEDTLVEVNPYVSSFPKVELNLPDPFEATVPYERTQFIAPLLEDVLKIIEQHGNSEWIILSSPDVLLKQKFYSVIEHYLASGHDAIAISTSNTLAPDLPLIRKAELLWHTWQISGYTQHVDCFVFSRKFLENLKVKNATAILPFASEILMANLLNVASRFKFLYEESITCRLNNILFWENTTRYDKLIRDNYKIACDIFSSISFTSEQKKSEHYRRIELRLENRKAQKLRVNRTGETEEHRNLVIRKNPEVLKGTSWAISTYFNPSRSPKILENYKNFSSGLKKQKVPLLTVELSFRPGTFDLTKLDSDLLVQVDDGDVLWQKERMFNLALKYLPAECDKVVYMDGDIIFADPQWLVKTEELLRAYCFVQPFSHVIRLPKEGQMLSLESYEVGWEDGQAIHSFAWGLEKFGSRALKNYPHHGTIGIALAARRSIMEKHGWFDADIVGSGDLLTIDSIFLADNYRANLMNPSFKKAFEKWQVAFRKDSKNSLTYTPGAVYHLWHGSSKNRFYQERHRILEDYDFDPNSDIELSKQGVWKWASEKIQLQKAVKSYFRHRDDD